MLERVSADFSLILLNVSICATRINVLTLSTTSNAETMKNKNNFEQQLKLTKLDPVETHSNKPKDKLKIFSFKRTISIN